MADQISMKFRVDVVFPTESCPVNSSNHIRQVAPAAARELATHVRWDACQRL